MFRKCIVVSVVCLLMLVAIPAIYAGEEPEAKIIIRRSFFGRVWVQVKDIREERPYPLPFNWTLETSKIFTFITEGFLVWVEPRIETRSGVIGSDLTVISEYGFWGTSTFEIDVHAGNVEKHAIGFVVLGRAYILFKH